MAGQEIPVQYAEQIPRRLIKIPQRRKEAVRTSQEVAQHLDDPSYAASSGGACSQNSVLKRDPGLSAEDATETGTGPRYESIFASLDPLTLRDQALEGSFVYEPLPDASKWIRLLQIETSLSNNAICCKLATYEINRAPRYGAISYAWGSASSAKRRGKNVRIDGNNFEVRQNCCHALDQIRVNTPEISKMGIMHYWIDSICINQADLNEKAAQVQTMCSEIFPNATKVFVSLENGFPVTSRIQQAVEAFKRSENPRSNLDKPKRFRLDDTADWESYFHHILNQYARTQCAGYLESTGIPLNLPVRRNNPIDYETFEVHGTGILVDVSEFNVTHVFKDSNGRLSVNGYFDDEKLLSQRNEDLENIWLPEKIESSFYCNAPEAGNTCAPLYQGSMIVGWLCSGATVGDALLEFRISGQELYLVIRACGEVNSGSFRIIGQAVLSQKFSTASEGGLSKLPAFQKHWYLCVDMVDLMSLTVPSYLESNVDTFMRGIEQHKLRAAIPWPKSTKPTFIHWSLAARNGSGSPA